MMMMTTIYINIDYLFKINISLYAHSFHYAQVFLSIFIYFTGKEIVVPLPTSHPFGVQKQSVWYVSCHAISSSSLSCHSTAPPSAWLDMMENMKLSLRKGIQ